MSSKNIYPEKYYVYFYLREDGTPYYVGKGKNYRAWSKNRTFPPPSDKDRIVIIKSGLDEDEAFELEKYYISLYGRKDINSGILRNLTNGGEGSNGLTITDEYRKKMSENAKQQVINGKHPWTIREDGSSQAKNNAIIKVKDGTHPFLKREDGSSVGSDNSRYAVENGTHPFLKREDGSSIGKDNTIRKIKDGTHPFLKREDGSSVSKDSAIRKVKDGTHPLLKREDGSSISSDCVKNGTNSLLKKSDGTSIGKSINEKRVADGTHQLLNSVSCYNKEGIFMQISKELYYSQSGNKSDWEWVTCRSNEGKKRKVK